MSKDPYSRPARPWDIFNKNLEKVKDTVSQERMDICKQCPEFINLTDQCKKCGCIMSIKTKLPNAYCPIGKWDAIRVGFKEETE
jgi:rRNA maturation protein Nop10